MRTKSKLSPYVKLQRHKESDKKWRNNRKQFFNQLTNTMLHTNVKPVEGRITKTKILETSMEIVQALTMEVKELLKEKRDSIFTLRYLGKSVPHNVNTLCVSWEDIQKAYGEFVRFQTQKKPRGKVINAVNVFQRLGYQDHFLNSFKIANNKESCEPLDSSFQSSCQSIQDYSQGTNEKWSQQSLEKSFCDGTDATNLLLKNKMSAIRRNTTPSKKWLQNSTQNTVSNPKRKSRYKNKISGLWNDEAYVNKKENIPPTLNDSRKSSRNAKNCDRKLFIDGSNKNGMSSDKLHYIKNNGGTYSAINNATLTQNISNSNKNSDSEINRRINEQYLGSVLYNFRPINVDNNGMMTSNQYYDNNNGAVNFYSPPALPPLNNILKGRNEDSYDKNNYESSPYFDNNLNDNRCKLMPLEAIYENLDSNNNDTHQQYKNIGENILGYDGEENVQMGKMGMIEIKEYESCQALNNSLKNLSVSVEDSAIVIDESIDIDDMEIFSRNMATFPASDLNRTPNTTVLSWENNYENIDSFNHFDNQEASLNDTDDITFQNFNQCPSLTLLDQGGDLESKITELKCKRKLELKSPAHEEYILKRFEYQNSPDFSPQLSPQLGDWLESYRDLSVPLKAEYHDTLFNHNFNSADGKKVNTYNSNSTTSNHIITNHYFNSENLNDNLSTRTIAPTSKVSNKNMVKNEPLTTNNAFIINPFNSNSKSANKVNFRFTDKNMDASLTTKNKIFEIPTATPFIGFSASMSKPQTQNDKLCAVKCLPRDSNDPITAYRYFKPIKNDNYKNIKCCLDDTRDREKIKQIDGDVPRSTISANNRYFNKPEKTNFLTPNIRFFQKSNDDSINFEEEKIKALNQLHLPELPIECVENILSKI